MATRNITIVNTTEKILDFKYMSERKCAYDQRSTFESIQFVLIKQARGTGGIQPRKQHSNRFSFRLIDSVCFDQASTRAWRDATEKTRTRLINVDLTAKKTSKKNIKQ